MYEVPLPIPDIEYQSLPDEGGFTMPEKIALRNAWTLIGPRSDELAKEQFLDYFSDYENTLNRFRDENGEIKMFELHAHPYNIFSFLEAIVFEGLEGVLQMHGIISPIAIGHMKNNVPTEDIELMCRELGAFLKKVLKRLLSPTLEIGIDKICNVILNAHKNN